MARTPSNPQPINPASLPHLFIMFNFIAARLLTGLFD